MKINIKVIANSKQQKVEKSGDKLKVHLKAIPQKGKANEELIKLLSKYFKVKRNQVILLKGHISNMKEVRIIG